MRRKSSPCARWATVLPRPERAVVSVAIRSAQQGHFTYYCLRSFLANNEGPAHKVATIHDASTGATPELVLMIENIRVVRHEQSEGFMASRNDGATQARGAFLCFLNGETLVTKSWLWHLTGTAEFSPACGGT